MAGFRHPQNVVITVKHPEDEEHDEPWREVIVVGVPGDRTVDMKRLEAQFAPAELEEATEEDLKQHPELVPVTSDRWCLARRPRLLA